MGRPQQVVPVPDELMFLAATNASTGSATSLPVPWASTINGDWCLLVVVLGGLAAITNPSGWTAVDSLDESTLRVKSYWHKCDGSESGSLNVSWGSAQAAVVGMVAYRYADATSPVYGHVIAGGVSSATSRTDSALASMVMTCEDIRVWADVQTTAVQVWTPPSGYRVRVNTSAPTSPFVSLIICDGNGPVAPDANQQFVFRTATSSQAGTAYVANHIATQLTPVSSAAQQFQSAAWPPADSAIPPAFIAQQFQTAVWLPAGQIPFGSVAPTPTPPLTIGQLWPRGRK
jgi:hypothetical protein